MPTKKTQKKQRPARRSRPQEFHNKQSFGPGLWTLQLSNFKQIIQLISKKNAGLVHGMLGLQNPFQPFSDHRKWFFFTQSWEAATEEESQVANLLLKTIASKLESHGLIFYQFQKRVSWNWYQVWEIGTVHKDCGNEKPHRNLDQLIYML